jgi:hypothetical protein
MLSRYCCSRAGMTLPLEGAKQAAGGAANGQFFEVAGGRSSGRRNRCGLCWSAREGVPGFGSGAGNGLTAITLEDGCGVGRFDGRY